MQTAVPMTCGLTTGLASGNDLLCTGPALFCFIFSYFQPLTIKKIITFWQTAKSAGIAGQQFCYFSILTLPAAFRKAIFFSGQTLLLSPGPTQTLTHGCAPLAKHIK